MSKRGAQHGDPLRALHANSTFQTTIVVSARVVFVACSAVPTGLFIVRVTPMEV
jgi:hypothetical protein